jgi:lysyl-tRNA synthetase class 2
MEKTLDVQELTLLSKCLHALPDKHNGLNDEETRLRKRYLDLLVNEDTRERFKFRHKILSAVKKVLDENEFVEVETPMLQTLASGALATPFKTHHKALDIPLFLRIAPETYLKRLIAGGYERVYEMGKNFRNEGVDPSHLQEFTMLEFYAAYWNFEDAIKFVEKIFEAIFEGRSKKIIYQGKEIDFSPGWKRISYADLFKQYTKLDLLDLLKDENRLFEACSKFVDVTAYKSAASLIDGVYKKLCRPNLVNPTVITNQPAVLGPLARQNDENPFFSDRFQVVVDGLEIVNSYSELVDPIKQREVLEGQLELRDKGEEEAMELEEDFLHAMEYAMPPMAGVGIGIDRVVAILTDAKNLREVVFFPNLK